MRVLPIVIAGCFVAHEGCATLPTLPTLPNDRRELSVFQATHISMRIKHGQGRNLAVKLGGSLRGRL